MFLRDYARTFGVSLLQGGVNVLLPLVFSRLWSKEQFGLFCYILVVAGLIQVVIDYGFSIQTVKAISEQPENVREIFLKQVSAKNIISVTTMIVLVVFTFYFYGTSISAETSTILAFWLLLLSTVFYSYSLFLTFPFQGLKNFKHANKMTLYSNLVCVLIILCPVLFFPHIISLLMSSGLFCMGRLCGLIVNVILARNILGVVKNIVAVKFNLDAWHTLIHGAPFALGLFFALAYFQTDTLFVKYFLGYDAVSIYQVGIRLVIMVTFITGIFNTVAFPYLMRAQGHKESTEFRQIMINCLTFGGGGLALILMFCSPWITLFFGQSFATLARYTPFFGLIILIRSFGNGAALLVMMSDQQQQRSLFLLLALMVAVISNIILIPCFHLWGALISAIITLLVLNACYQWLLWVKTRSFLINKRVLLIFSYFIMAMLVFYLYPWFFGYFRFFILIVYGIVFFRKIEFMRFIKLC